MDNNKNVNIGNVKAKGNVHFGDIINNLKESAQYKKLLEELKQTDLKIEQTKRKIERHPEDEDYQVDLLELSKGRNDKAREIETLEKDVLKLIEDFSYLHITTSRLRFAWEYVKAGEYEKARAVLDAERMNTELEDAIKLEEIGQDMVAKGKAKRSELATEFMIKAQLTSFDFSLPDRFNTSLRYFEQSLNAERNLDNLSAYIIFLEDHNQFSKLEPLFEEVIINCRKLSGSGSKSFSPKLVEILNQYGWILSVKGQLPDATNALQEALHICREYVTTESATYLPLLSTTLNSLGVLLSKEGDYEESDKAFKESLVLQKH